MTPFWISWSSNLSKMYYSFVISHPISWPWKLEQASGQAIDLLSTQSKSWANFRVVEMFGLVWSMVCGRCPFLSDAHKPVRGAVQNFIQPWNLPNSYSEWITDQLPASGRSHSLCLMLPGRSSQLIWAHIPWRICQNLSNSVIAKNYGFNTGWQVRTVKTYWLQQLVGR